MPLTEECSLNHMRLVNTPLPKECALNRMRLLIMNAILEIWAAGSQRELQGEISGDGNLGKGYKAYKGLV